MRKIFDLFFFWSIYFDKVKIKFMNELIFDIDTAINIQYSAVCNGII